jgi:hypothetical protein
VLIQYCNTPYLFCIDDSIGGAACLESVCTPGVAACDANEVKICDEQGQYPSQGSDCGAQACFDGACLPRVCQTATDTCQDGNIQTCVDNGTATMLSMECPLGTQCFALDTYAECGLDRCDPEGAACLGNQVGTCDAGGGSLSSVTDDCAADGLVCGLDLLCAATVVDTIAGQGTLFPDAGGSLILLNLIDVYTDRRVTLLEHHLVLEDPSELTWLVYEWLDDHYVLRLDDKTQASAGEAVYASNPLSYDLKAGRRYALGIYSASNASFYSGDATNSWLSFGRVRGGLIGNGYNYLFPDDFDFPSSESQLRITTGFPAP